MPTKSGPICKFKCQHCNSYYTECMTYEEYTTPPRLTGAFFKLVTIINPDCGCCKYTSCDKCKCHVGTAGFDFKFEKEYIGEIWYPDLETMCDSSDEDLS